VCDTIAHACRAAAQACTSSSDCSGGQCDCANETCSGTSGLVCTSGCPTCTFANTAGECNAGVVDSHTETLDCNSTSGTGACPSGNCACDGAGACANAD
jgi:hypothetical protein